MLFSEGLLPTRNGLILIAIKNVLSLDFRTKTQRQLHSIRSMNLLYDSSWCLTQDMGFRIHHEHSIMKIVYFSF